MIKMILEWIAGADRKVLKRCPSADKNSIRHLGMWLCLTFLLVWVTSFLSLNGVLNSRNVFGDMSTTMMGASASKALFFLLFSGVIATMVFLFDRWLFMGDWFNELPIGSAPNPATISRRFLKGSIRIIISIALAYGLGTLLSLTLLQGQIQDEMRRESLRVNDHIFVGLDRFTAELDNGIKVTANDIETSISGMKNDRTLLESMQAEKLEKDRQVQILQAKIGDLYNKAVAEETGKNPLNLEGISMNPKCGPLCKTYLAAAEQAEMEQQLVQSNIQELSAGIIRLKARSDQADSRINAKRKELERQSFSRTKAVQAERERLMSRGDFIPIQDGFLARHSALKRLSNDPELGASVVAFTMMIKGLIMLLELMPVIAKLFMPQPSAYSIALQYEIELAQVSARLKFEADVGALDKEIERAQYDQLARDFKRQTRESAAREISRGLSEHMSAA